MLDGIGQGVDLNDLHRSVGERFTSDRTLSPRVLLDLAAAAFVACRVSPDAPLELDGLDRHLLPEWPARGNTAHQKRRYALQAAILIAVGVEPEDASWCRHDDLWSHAFDAVIEALEDSRLALRERRAAPRPAGRVGDGHPRAPR